MTVRVLHVLPHRGGGAETYIDMLERLDGFEHRRFYLSAARTPLRAAASIPPRWPLLAGRVRRADVVHSHGDAASVIALPLLRTRPAVMTCQGLHLLRRVHGVNRAAMVRAVAAVVRASRAVICSSKSERDELASIVDDRDARKLLVVHNGVDPPPAVDKRRRTSIRAELGASHDTVLGLFVGQLEARKAPMLAASAAMRARRQGAPFVLAFAGDGPLAPELGAMDGEAVKLLGFRSDVPELLDAADVFIHPSEREGMSFALLEAMAHGLAVVAADGSSNPEAVGDAGILFAAGDQGALVDAIARVSSDAALRNSLGAQASARARQQFSPAAFLGASEEIYQRALRRLMVPGQADGGPPA